MEVYMKKWETNEDYQSKEEVLNRLFMELRPKNVNLSDILIKVSTLNNFYSTNFFSIYPVAKRIYLLNIDDRLQEGDTTLVNDILRVRINGKQKRVSEGLKVTV